jgi:hypothetical protein
MAQGRGRWKLVWFCQCRLADGQDFGSVVQHGVGIFRVMQAAVGDRHDAGRMARDQRSEAQSTAAESRLPCLEFGLRDVVDPGVHERTKNDFGIVLTVCPLVPEIVDLALRDSNAYGNVTHRFSVHHAWLEGVALGKAPVGIDPFGNASSTALVAARSGGSVRSGFH